LCRDGFGGVVGVAVLVAVLGPAAAMRVCPATITGVCVEIAESNAEEPCRGRCVRAYLLPGCEDMIGEKGEMVDVEKGHKS
jgi:hypothetical protein